MKEYTPEPIVETAEQKGWAKKVQYQIVVAVRIADIEDYGKIKPKLFLRTVEIDFEKYFDMNTCNHCKANGHGNRFHYGKACTDAVVAICWVCAVHYGRSAFTIKTIENVLTSSMSDWCRIVSEKPISVKDAMMFYKREGKVIDGTVLLMLNEIKDKFEVA